MDIRKFFAALLTILGIAGLIFAAFSFASGESTNWRKDLVFGVLGIIFFSAGIRLINSIPNRK
jgi:hypothetical protein